MYDYLLRIMVNKIEDTPYRARLTGKHILELM